MHHSFPGVLIGATCAAAYVRTMKRVAIVGPGRIGSAFAYRLARAGDAVTVVARGARLETLRRDAAIVAVDGTRAPVTVMDRLDTATPYDLLLVTVMAHQVDETLLAALVPSHASTVLFMFNTFEDLAPFRSAVGARRFEVGFPNMIAFLVDGRLRHVVDGPGMVTTLSSPAWAEHFVAAGLPAVVETDMQAYLRSHAAFVVPLMVAALWTWKRGESLRWSEARRLTAALLESLALVRALGHGLKPRLVSLLPALPAVVLTGAIWAFARTRANRDLGEFGPAEVRALIDAMTAAAPGSMPALAAIRP